jgi:Tripartite tricarboxylate transporter family receptor
MPECELTGKAGWGSSGHPPWRGSARRAAVLPRQTAGKLSLAYDTTAGAAAFAARLLNKRADLGLAEVPYRSAAQMGQDIAAGVTQAMMSSIAAANPFIQAGKIRRIAITSATRFPGLPELPSVNEILPGIRHERLVWCCRSGRRASRYHCPAQSGDRRVSQRSGHPAKAAVIWPRHERLRNARKHRATGGARTVEGASEGTRYQAPMMMLRGPETVKSGNVAKGISARFEIEG